MGESLVAAVPTWLRKLKRKAIVAGDSFRHSIWSDGVVAIASVFGIPDSISEGGFW